MVKHTNKKMKRVILILCFLSILGCNFHTAEKNNPIDKDLAEKTSTEFYASILTKKFEDVLPLFDNSFFTGMSKDKFTGILKSNNEKLGNLITWELIHWETLKVAGTKESESKYLLVYKVDYEDYSAEETFSLKLDKGIIKIVGYDVRSEGFLNQ